MPRPRYRRRVDLSKLNPYDAHDMEIINREWQRLQARRIREGNREHRRAQRRGWIRVIAVIAIYLVIGVAVLGCVGIILTAVRILFG